MHSFNLRFGVAKTPVQEAAYDQLYPMLVQLRDQAQAQGPSPMTAQAPLPDPKQATSFFSGMDYSHFQPQPRPGTGPPPPRPGMPGERDLVVSLQGIAQIAAILSFKLVAEAMQLGGCVQGVERSQRDTLNS